MKRLLRFLIGGKGKAPLPNQARIEPAHELAMKAVVRRRGAVARSEARAASSGNSGSSVVSGEVTLAVEDVIRRKDQETPFSPLGGAEREQGGARVAPSLVSPGRGARKAMHQLADIAMYGRVMAKPRPKPKARLKHQLADIGGALE